MNSPLKRNVLYCMQLCKNEQYMGMISYIKAAAPSAYIRRQLRLNSKQAQNSNQIKLVELKSINNLYRFLGFVK